MKYWQLYKDWWEALGAREPTSENIALFAIVCVAHLIVAVIAIMLFFSILGAWGLMALALLSVIVAVVNFSKFLKDQDAGRDS